MASVDRVCPRSALLALLVLLLAFTAAGCGRQSADEAARQAGTDTVAADTGAFDLGDGEEEQGGTGAFGDALSGRIRADGSSTVGPFLSLAAERFGRDNPDVKVTVGVSGTGGGFERFCRGETDLSTASRPIKDEEEAACRKKGVEYAELAVSNDALSVIVNPANDWVDCLTVEQLRRIWEPDSEIDAWNEVESRYPDVDLKLFGAGTDSGTFDYFTDAIVGEEGKSRADYSATEDDNVTVRGVAGEKGALGYLGFSYFEQNQGKLKAVEIDGGNGCVAPSVETVQGGSYTPLGRPLFVYVKKSVLERLEVETFLQYIVENETALARGALFVPLTEDQLQETQTALEQALSGIG